MHGIPTADDYRTPDAYPLEIGDRVYDIKQLCDETVDEPEAVIVIDVLEDDVYGASFQTTSGTETLSEYGPNVEYADFDVSERVVSIVFEQWLDANVPRWDVHRDTPEGFKEYLNFHAESWGVPVFARAYDYPESRLASPDGLAKID